MAHQHVAVLGLGYVGCVSAACLANLGFRVTGVDRDEHKVRNVADGHAPFYEPGLEEMVQANAASGLLTATTNLVDGVRDADIALVCVGTPSERNGNLGLEQLRRVVSEIAATLDNRTKPIVIAIRSTVFPGTCEEVVLPALGAHRAAKVVSNPEFLREGTAVKDFLEPSLIVVGGDEPEPVRMVASLYDALGTAPCLVSLRTAEMIKYACNAFHAVKICFSNEVGALSEKLGVNAREVMETLCQDEKLNVSAAYLKPGFAFGGSCLPKDLRALIYRAGRLDVSLPMLESAIPSNEEHLARDQRMVMELPAKRLGIIGLAFKEDTDDLRESPVVNMLEYLIGKGRDVKVFDPHIRLEGIYGTNRKFLLESIPHIGRLMTTSIEDVLGWAEHLVIAQKQKPPVMAKIEASGLPWVDLVSRLSGAGTSPATALLATNLAAY